MIANDLKIHVISSTLDHLKLNSVAAIQLLLGTAAVESCMGRYLKQQKGPALGIYQIEPFTHFDICNYLATRQQTLRHRVKQLRAEIPGNLDLQLITNLMYATAIARVIYYRIPEPLPHAHDIEGMARYWKRYYNTEQGAGTLTQFLECYDRYCI